MPPSEPLTELLAVTLRSFPSRTFFLKVIFFVSAVNETEPLAADDISTSALYVWLFVVLICVQSEVIVAFPVTSSTESFTPFVVFPIGPWKVVPVFASRESE